MAIMRTNRLASTTTKQEKTIKPVTVSNNKRSFIPVSELEAQDAAYEKYKKDLSIYEGKMERYTKEAKLDKNQKDYLAFFGGKQNVRYLGKDELAAYNKQNSASDPTSIEYGAVEVPKSFSKKVGDKDWMVGTAHHTHKPIKPTAPVVTKPGDWSMVELNPIKTKDASFKSKSAPKKLKQRSTEETEKAEFTSPGVEKKKVKRFQVDGIHSQGMNRMAQGAKVKGKLGRYAKQLHSNTGIVERNKDMSGYNRQEKLFKAYAGTSVLGESHIGKSAQELGDYKREFKQMKKDYRREGNAEGVVAAGMEAKQAGRAQKFVRGSQKHFNDPNYQKTTGSENPIAIDYRDSRDNAANRNTMEQKLKSVSSRSKIGKDTGYMNNPMY